MTKKFVTRALVLTGLFTASVTAGFAQANVASHERRVAPSMEKAQPVAASALIMSSGMSLTSDQRTQISRMSGEVAALHTERARLWSEYRAIKARPNFDDAMAASEAAPRMLRIVEINNQLAPIVARQEPALTALLSTTQRTQLAKLVASEKSAL